MRTICNAGIVLVATIALVLCAPSEARAQLRGDYPPGFMGLQSGTQAPPGISISAPTFIYATDTIKNDDGDTLGVHPQINMTLFGAGVAWVSNFKVLGGTWGGNFFGLPFMNDRIEGAVLEIAGSLGFSDLYVQPLQLGWHTERADYVAGYALFLPTGEFRFASPDNSGLGMISHDLQGGTTVRLDNDRRWTLSALGTYEIHQKKRDTDVTVGDTFTVEGGLGRAFYEKVDGATPLVANVGLVYYGQWKVTEDTAPIISPLLAGAEDRVYGLGGEANMFIPRIKMLVGARLLGELGARNRTQGVTFMVNVAYEAKSLARPAATP